MKALRLPTVALLALVLVCFGTVASASIIGDLKTSSGNGTTTVSLSSISYSTDTTSIPPGPPWNAEVTNTTVLMFAGCPSGVLGAAGCLVSAEGVEFANGNPIVLGAGLAANNPFIQFAAHPSLLFTITGAGPGSANTVCPSSGIGLSCSVFGGSPILLTLTATGTNVSFAVFGTATDGAGTSNWISQFSTPITGMTPIDIQLFFCPSGTCMPADFSSGRSITKPAGGAFFADGVPEAAPLTL